MSSPLISVLLAVHNGGALLDEAIQSILAQTLGDFELLVIDDGSTDDSHERAAAFKDERIRILRNETNIGLTRSLNRGLAEARGEYVARQDADDLSAPHRFAAQVEYLRSHPDVVLLGTSSVRIDPKGATIGTNDLPTSHDAIRWASLVDNPFLHTSVMFRRGVVQREFGGYDEKYAVCQDYDLWNRIAAKFRVANLPERLVLMREHESSMTRSQTTTTDGEFNTIMLRNFETLFPKRKFVSGETQLLSLFRQRFDQADLQAVEMLMDALRSDFQSRHPDTVNSKDFRKTLCRQKLRLAFKFLTSPQVALSRILDALQIDALESVKQAAHVMTRVPVLGRLFRGRRHISSKERVRVLHVIDSFDLGGGQTALLNLIKAMNRERYEPEVACMHGHGVFWDEFAALGIPVHSLSPKRNVPLYLPRLAWLIFRRRPLIVHCHLFGSNWIAKPLATLMGVRVRVNHDQCNDGVRHEKPWLRWLDMATNWMSSHVCAVSASTRDFLVQREYLDPGRVSLVYNGIEMSQFKPRAPRVRGDAFVVAGVGRLHPQKNFSLFFDVAAELLKRGLSVRFVIAGTGPEEQALRSRCAVLGIARHVQFLGHVRDTASLYAASDALLMTSNFEGTPLTILEAMAMRLPIVAPKLDGIGEILKDGVDALLVSPPDVGRYADAVTRIYKERELAQRLVESAEKNVHQNFSATTMTTAVETIYERCLAGG
ncbi:MAG TPA: glycosyltransferase [Chthoniobacteraceae bacterium]|nr:glycosyltransferase [Chthoniobacteraceae bacterium]